MYHILQDIDCGRHLFLVQLRENFGNRNNKHTVRKGVRRGKDEDKSRDIHLVRRIQDLILNALLCLERAM
jgi:hypothetical protein